MTELDFKWAPANIVEGAEELVKLRNNKDPWTVIEKIVEIWQSTNPKKYKSHLIQLDETKSTRKVTSVGSKQFSGISKDKGGAYLRYTIDIPEKVIYLIRRLYTPNELPMDKKFYKELGRRFPKMIVSEVV